MRQSGLSTASGVAGPQPDGACLCSVCPASRFFKIFTLLSTLVSLLHHSFNLKLKADIDGDLQMLQVTQLHEYLPALTVQYLLTFFS